MEYDLFRNKVQQVKAKKPILFALLKLILRLL